MRIYPAGTTTHFVPPSPTISSPIRKRTQTRTDSVEREFLSSLQAPDMAAQFNTRTFTPYSVIPVISESRSLLSSVVRSFFHTFEVACIMSTRKYPAVRFRHDAPIARSISPSHKTNQQALPSQLIISKPAAQRKHSGRLIYAVSPALPLVLSLPDNRFGENYNYLHNRVTDYFYLFQQPEHNSRFASSALHSFAIRQGFCTTFNQYRENGFRTKSNTVTSLCFPAPRPTLFSPHPDAHTVTISSS